MNFALIGAPGSGKSSIADALGVRMSFADGVRREVAGYLGPILQMHSDEIRELLDLWSSGVTHSDILRYMTDPITKDAFRPLLQVWGTDFRRAQDPDYWCRALETRIRRSMAEDSSRRLVVDDCRFPNEYNLLKSLGFKFVTLESGANTRPLSGAQLAHESERYWPRFSVDLVLDYKPGPGVQAQRILALMGEKE
ncbi:MAG: hypothetical protein LC118_03085 [Dehalococcoidia bacterium]|nr:hypothetical protein [Dehalococcoidia bacterium]